MKETIHFRDLKKSTRSCIWIRPPQENSTGFNHLITNRFTRMYNHSNKVNIYPSGMRFLVLHFLFRLQILSLHDLGEGKISRQKWLIIWLRKNFQLIHGHGGNTVKSRSKGLLIQETTTDAVPQKAALRGSKWSDHPQILTSLWYPTAASTRTPVQLTGVLLLAVRGASYLQLLRQSPRKAWPRL